MTPQRLVTEFHQKYGAAINQRTDEVLALRTRLIEEEFEEVFEELIERWDVTGEVYALKPSFNVNLVALAKELADLVYVVYGTAVSLGIDLDKALAAVHASNMTKTLPAGEIPNQPKKIQKGPDYQAPDLSGVVKEI